jgi:hypothetical protein
VIEIRCPKTGHMFGKLTQAIESSVLIEVACKDCRVNLRRQGETVGIVLHYFTTDGSFKRTQVLADTILLTVPNQLGVDYNAHLLQTVAKHIAPALGWEPAFDTREP